MEKWQASPRAATSRIAYSRRELIERFIEVEQPSQLMLTNLKDNTKIPLGKHIISEYVIRPVACDKNPYSIKHVNPYNEASK